MGARSGGGWGSGGAATTEVAGGAGLGGGCGRGCGGRGGGGGREGCNIIDGLVPGAKFVESAIDILQKHLVVGNHEGGSEVVDRGWAGVDRLEGLTSQANGASEIIDGLLLEDVDFKQHDGTDLRLEALAEIREEPGWRIL